MMLDNFQQVALEETLNEQIETANKMFSRDPQKAFALADSALQTAELEGYAHTGARALRVRAMCYRAMGNIEASRVDFQTALDQAEILHDALLQSQCLHGLGNVHFFRGEFALALEFMHRSIALRRRIGDEHGLMIGLTSLGAYLAELGDFPNAVAHFTDSLQIARRRSDHMHEALALSNIGQAKLDFGEYDQAVAHLSESLRLWSEGGSHFYEPIAMEILAMAKYRLGKLDEALEIGQRGIQASQNIGNRHLEVNILYVVALIQTDRGEPDIAEQLFLEALEKAQTIQSGTKVAEIYGALGRLYLRRSEFDAAQKYLDEGLAYAQQTQQKQHLSEMHLALSELYAAMGDYRQALEAHHAYHEMYRVQQKESAQNRLSAQLAGLEVERALQQAEIHRLRNVELVHANRQNAELVERLQQHAQQLAELATKDPLTGLYNRRYLQDYLHHELEKPHHRIYLSVAVADLDNFKQVNDRFSHLIGDEVLKVIARLIQNTVRHSDIAVRFGGEEFVIVFPELLRGGAAEVCERVRRAVAAYNWASIHPDLKMTTSIGVADTMEDTSEMAEFGSATERLLGLADQRLYHAKEAGKNQIV